MTETQFDSVARMTVATPLEAHTYVEAIKVIPEEPDVFPKGIMKRRNILLVLVAAPLRVLPTFLKNFYSNVLLIFSKL